MDHTSKTDKALRDLWRTPPEIFAALNAEFNFQMDAAASKDNTLCPLYISEAENALITSWPSAMGFSGYVWCNPPYSDILPWVRKAADENKWASVGCVMLIPADTSVKWFKEAVASASEIRFIVGRLAFLHPSSGKPVSGGKKGSMLVIWHPQKTACKFSVIDRDTLIVSGSNSEFD